MDSSADDGSVYLPLKLINLTRNSSQPPGGTVIAGDRYRFAMINRLATQVLPIPAEVQHHPRVRVVTDVLRPDNTSILSTGITCVNVDHDTDAVLAEFDVDGNDPGYTITLVVAALPFDQENVYNAQIPLTVVPPSNE